MGESKEASWRKWAYFAAFWKGTEEDNVITNPSCRLEGISDDEG